MENTFKVLNAVDCNEHTEKKDKLTYLSWSWAWQIVKNNYPDASYQINHWDGKPYLSDSDYGIMVETSVTIQNQTHTMWLPVMDNMNQALKDRQYDVKKSVWENGKKVEKIVTIRQATMFDINTAIMRCLTKNLAMFGLGLYIYAGEDIPSGAIEVLKEVVNSAKTSQEIVEIWNANTAYHTNQEFKEAVATKGKELKKKEEVVNG